MSGRVPGQVRRASAADPRARGLRRSAARLAPPPLPRAARRVLRARLPDGCAAARGVRPRRGRGAALVPPPGHGRRRSPGHAVPSPPGRGAPRPQGSEPARRPGLARQGEGAGCTRRRCRHGCAACRSRAHQLTKGPFPPCPPPKVGDFNLRCAVRGCGPRGRWCLQLAAAAALLACTVPARVCGARTALPPRTLAPGLPHRTALQQGGRGGQPADHRHGPQPALAGEGGGAGGEVQGAESRE